MTFTEMIRRFQKYMGWGKEDNFTEELPEFDPLDQPLFVHPDRANPLVVQNVVDSILTYAKLDAEHYEDITLALMEYNELSIFEGKMAFFYLLGQYILLAQQMNN